MGKSKAPSQDPRIGEAAMRSAELGEDYLAWMMGQSEISNGWAKQDRERYKTTFEPLQDQFIAEAQGYDTAKRRKSEARRAAGAVRSNAALQDAATRRSMARMGVDPRSGRYDATKRALDLRTGLAAAGADTTARRQVEATGRSLRAAAVDLGSGMAVNPAQSLSMASGTAGSGFGGAMQGQAQMSNTLNRQYQNEMQVWQANQASTNSLFGAAGGLAGAFLLSSKEVKEEKKPVRRSLLKEVRSMPVEDWKYKEGAGDGGHHTGPYAEDFQKATGKGDGKTIDVIDAIGVTMGAVQELADKVDGLTRRSMAPAKAA